MRSFLCNKFIKPASKDTGKDRGNSLSTKSNVNEEYLKAFRSNSYEEIWDKVHGQLGFVTTTTITSVSATGYSSSSNLSSPFYLDLSDSLLEPRQEILKTMIERLKFHRLLVEYFEASLRACNICELLLRSINQARADHHRKIKRVIKISKTVLFVDHASDDDDRDQNIYQNNRYCRAMFRELKVIAALKNPLSIISPPQVRAIREGYVILFHKLTVKEKKVKRREKLKKVFKRAGSVGLVVAHNALLIALLILAFHSVFGIAAAPTLVGFSSISYLCKRKKKSSKTTCLAPEKGRFVKSLGCKQFDIAARGIFILINDFDTMCQMVRRLQDEIEHRRSVAEICVRNGKFEVVREVVKELSEQELSFVEQLEELEEYIYLCLLTINRSRRLVIQEIISSHCHE